MRDALRTLEKLQNATGYSAAKDPRVAQMELEDRRAEEEKLRKMNDYERAEYIFVKELQTARGDITASEELAAAPHTSQVEVVRQSNKVRKQMSHLTQSTKELQRLATKFKKQDRCADVIKHYERTRAAYRKTAVNPDDVTTTTAGSTAETPLLKARATPISELPNADMGVSLRDDPEFQQLFEQVTQNDVKIDQAVDRILVGTQRIAENARLLAGELKTQERMLDDTDRKLDRASESMNRLNKRLKGVIKKVDEDKMCLYAICCVILLGIGGFVCYEMKLFK